MPIARATRFVSALALSALIALGPAIAAQAVVDPTPDETPTPPPVLVSPAPADDAVEAICEDAAELIEADKPQAALDLIEALRAPGSDGGDKYLENIRFKCEPERIAALTALANPVTPGQTKAETFGKQWDSFVKTWVTPLVTSWVAIIGIFIGLVILGRVAATIPGPGRGIREGDRRGVLILSLLFMASSAVAFVGAFRGFGTEGFEQPPWATLAFLVGLGLVGSLLFGVALARRLRIAVDAQKSGADAPGTKGQIIDLLYRFGAAPPKGLELPAGGDLAVLAEGALPSALSGAVWANVQAVLKFVFLGTPWRFKIESDELTYATVNIQHNGVALPKVQISIPALKLPAGVDPPTALRVYAAAVIIVTLARHHGGFEELMGVRSWRSLGDLYLSSVVTDEAAKTDLRRTAHAADVRNRPAQLAILHAKSRRATTVSVLKPWVDWLANEVEEVETLPKRGDRPLDYELRIRRLLAIAEANLRQTKLPANPSPEDWAAYDASLTSAYGNVKALATHLEREDSLDEGPLRDQYRIDIALLFAETVNDDSFEDPRWTEDLKTWHGDALKSARPLVAYNVACHLVKMDRRARAVTERDAGEDAGAQDVGAPEGEETA